MAVVLSRRLGKRSLLGARISAPPLLADGVLMAAQVPPLQMEQSKGSPPPVSYEEGHFKDHVEEPGSQSQSGPVLQPGHKVYTFHNGQEVAGLVEHHDVLGNQVKVLLLDQGFSVCRKVEDVRLAEVQVSALPSLESDQAMSTTLSYSTIPAAKESCLVTAAAPRSVSRNIDVPKRLVAVATSSGSKFHKPMTL